MSDYSEGAAFVEGAYVPIDRARIPLLDTGFLRSDLTYDVAHVWQGSFFRLADHLERFERNCARLRLTPPHDRAEITAIVMELARRTGLRDAYVNMTCTRGVAARGVRDPRQYENRFYAYAVPFIWIARPEDQMRGLSMAVSSVERIPPASIDPTVKNFHWGDMVRGLYEAYDRGAQTAVLVDRDGNVTEGPGFNLFAWIDGALVTPGAGVLEGITRRTVLELAQEHGIPTRVGPLSPVSLRASGEVFCASTAGGVMPVTVLDGRPVGDGAPGPVTLRLRELYWAAHEDPRYSTPVSYD